MNIFIDYHNVIAVIIAYLIGSVPSAVWIGKIFFKTDVRELGSGNAGATNTARVLGVKAGIPVFIIDGFKGFLAVQLAFSFRGVIIYDETLTNFQIILAAAAVIGHVFPVFAGFRGGKGIATLFGIMIALFPFTWLISLGVFLIVFFIFRYVSLSSVITAILFPIVAIVIFKTKMPSLIIFSILVALFVPFTHKENIIRLFNGEESRFTFKKKK